MGMDLFVLFLLLAQLVLGPAEKADEEPLYAINPLTGSILGSWRFRTPLSVTYSLGDLINRELRFSRNAGKQRTRNEAPSKSR